MKNLNYVFKKSAIIFSFFLCFSSAGCKTKQYEESLSDKEYHGYTCEISCDTHCKAIILNSADETPSENVIGYSLEKDTYKLTQDGNGQLNFKIIPDEGYTVADISINGSYNSLKGPQKTNQANVYKITKIFSELQINITSREMTSEDFILDIGTDINDNGELYLCFDDPLGYIDKVQVDVSSSEDSMSQTICPDENVKNKLFVTSLKEKEIYSLTVNATSLNGLTYSCTLPNVQYYPSLKQYSIPRVEINTMNGVYPSAETVYAPEGYNGVGITNANYVDANVYIYDETSKLIYSSGKDYESAKIKIRGNTSAQTEKKPYKIKLDTSADLLKDLVERNNGTNYKNTEWLLLACGYDFNQLIGREISRIVNLPYVPEYRYVELYLNGDYRGIYLLSEAVSKGEGNGDSQSRIKVDEDGYIMESDAYWWNEDLYFDTPRHGQEKITFKYPDTDYFNDNPDSLEYIKNYVCNFESLLINNDKSCLNYIDLDSFARWAVTRNIISSYEPAGTNMFFYKKDSSESSKLVAGPVWDFDGAFLSSQVESFDAIIKSKRYYIAYLEKYSEFKSLYNEIFENIYSDINKKIIDIIPEKINETAFDILVKEETTKYKQSNYRTYDESVDYYSSWLNSHISFLQNNLYDL